MKKAKKEVKKPTKKVAKKVAKPKVKEEKGKIAPKKRVRPKSVVLADRKFFLANKQYLCDNKADFEYISTGNVDKIVYQGTTFISIDLKERGGKGYHLTNGFIRDIDLWLEKNGSTQKTYTNNYKEQLFNINAIERVVGEPSVMIDINDCYWRTAYLLGYITEQTYIIGKRKKEWKTGRNACIGGLCKVKWKTTYKNGIPEKRVAVRTKPEYQNIRNHIIGHVYNMFEQLFKQIGNSFYMFLTDCIVTSYRQYRFIETYFTGLGYKIKQKPVEFLELDRINKKVSWHDFDGVKKDDKGRITQKGVDRYYQYSNSQTIITDVSDMNSLYYGGLKKG